MFFSYNLIKHAYEGLKKLDSSVGKSRMEKVSALRHLFAISELLHRGNIAKINLSVKSKLRVEFIKAVGNVVSLNNEGLYSQDFDSSFSSSKDYKVRNNFLTMAVANSRDTDVVYPRRPEPLLHLVQEEASIAKNISKPLLNSYNIGAIKAELCIWLLRDEKFTVSSKTISASQMNVLIASKLKSRYTSDIVNAISPNDKELNKLISGIVGDQFVNKKSDYSGIGTTAIASKVKPLSARVLINDLPDEDTVFNTVQQLLDRGAKGILFTGPPGTSKTWYALKIALKIIDGDEDRLERVQFHPSFSYEDFIEGLVSTGTASGNEPMFKPKDKVFLNICNRARENSDEWYILVIDEFSRGDPSKIFGELLTHIEPDYREIHFRLPYSEKMITIPRNIIIFATMNPYDKSVMDLDSAMERRFDVVELLPSEDTLRKFLTSSKVAGATLGFVIKFFNEANRLSPRGFGHTYFKDVSEEIDFILLWNHKLRFIFEKMFRFEEDSLKAIRQSYRDIVSDDQKNNIV